MRALVICFVLFILSCKGEVDTVDTDDTVAHENTIREEADVTFEGTFAEKIKGENVELILKSNSTYVLKVNSKKYEGDFIKANDGNSIYLENVSQLPYHYFLMEEANTLLILDKDGNYNPEEEFFLNKQ